MFNASNDVQLTTRYACDVPADIVFEVLFI